MIKVKQPIRNKYRQLEIAFFFIYYILFSILSDIEYHLMEKGKMAFTLSELPDRLFYGFLSMLSGIVFYKWLIQRFLFEKKYLRFIGGLLVYLFALNSYLGYSYLLVSNLGFLPEEMTARAMRWLQNDSTMRFSLIYMCREFLVLTGLAYFIRSAQQDQRIAQLGKQQLKAELNYLKAQIQPHFYFNTLNNIYSLTLQRSEKAAPLVAKHADMMRYMLYTAEKPWISLWDEIQFLKNYVAVEAVRYPDRITIDFEVQGIQKSTQIPPLLLLPFIENPFKHGIREELNEGFVLIVLSQMGNELSLEVSNSKSSHNHHSLPGIGLKNAGKRLELLYPGRHLLQIRDETATYSLLLTLQLNTYD